MGVFVAHGQSLVVHVATSDLAVLLPLDKDIMLLRLYRVERYKYLSDNYILTDCIIGYDELKGDLRVWWIPQVPMQESFYVKVSSPREAKKILDVLAKYDLYQLDNNIKPDYCNAGELQEEDINGDWYEWDNDDGETIDEFEL